MFFIANRGNTHGKNCMVENTPEYIIEAISKGFDCKIDIWYIGEIFYLGNDSPHTMISLQFLTEYKNQLWIQCRNIDALYYMNYTDFHYFYHEKDLYNLTSKHYILGNLNSSMNNNIIYMMPEWFNNLDIRDLFNCKGICSDNVSYFKSSLKKIRQNGFSDFELEEFNNLKLS